jgi:hypothetical protein
MEKNSRQTNATILIVVGSVLIFFCCIFIATGILVPMSTWLAIALLVIGVVSPIIGIILLIIGIITLTRTNKSLELNSKL